MLQKWAQLAEKFAQPSRRWFGNCKLGFVHAGSVSVGQAVSFRLRHSIREPLRLMFDGLDLAFAAIAGGGHNRVGC